MYILELKQILVPILNHILPTVDQIGASLFLARDVIYTSRAYAMMPVSVCL